MIPSPEAFEALAVSYDSVANDNAGRKVEAHYRALATACRIAAKVVERNRLEAVIAKTDRVAMTGGYQFGDADAQRIADAIITYLTERGHD